MDKLSVTAMMQIIERIVPKDTSIAIANDKQFIYYHPNEFHNYKKQILSYNM